MESSSSGDGPSSTGRRSERPQQHWNQLVPGVVGETSCANGLPLQKLLIAATKLDIGSAPALLFTIQCEGTQAAVVCLNSSGADSNPNTPNNCGVTPLYRASGEGNCEIVEYLFVKRANVIIIFEDGEAPLQIGHARMLNACFLEEPRAFADTNIALLEKEFVDTTKCYTKESKLGYTYAALYNHGQQSSWAKSSFCKMAVCCALFWVTMKLGFGDISLPLLCADNFIMTDNLSLFSDPTGFAPNFLCGHGILITDRKVVGCSTQIRVQLVDIIQDMEVSNKATICLDESDDGTEHESLKSLQGGIGAIRAWCFKYGLHIPVLRIYGPDLMIYTTPAGGTFYLTIEHLERSLTLLLAGRNLYFRGWKGGQHGAFEIELRNQRYMLGDTTVLKIQENYRFLSPDVSVGETRMGPDALRQSFETLYKCQGERSRGLKRAIGIFAVHISEAARIQCVYKAECRSFLTYEQPTLDSTVENPSGLVLHEKKNSSWVTDYGHYCTEVMEDIENRRDGIATPGIKDREGALVRSPGEVFREMRIILRDACSEGAKEEKPPMIEDPDDHHNMMRLAERLKAGNKRPRMKQQESRGRSKKPRLDEISEGAGDVGPPLIGYLLEDLRLEVDKEEGEEIKEEANEEEEMKEVAEEEEEIEELVGEEEIEEEAGGEQKEEQDDSSYEDFLTHFPGARKFIEKKNQVRSFERTPRCLDVVSSVKMATQESILLSVRAKITSTRTKVFPQRSPLLHRPSRALLQPSLVRAGRFVSRFLRFL